MCDALSLIERSNEARRGQDHSAAVRLAEEAADAARSSADAHGVGHALAALGRLRRDEDQADDAVKLYEQAAQIAREKGDDLALAHRLRHIGDIVAEQGDLARAEQCYDEAGQIFETHETGKLNQANFLRSKALLRERQGANAAAAELWSDARALYVAVGTQAFRKAIAGCSASSRCKARPKTSSDRNRRNPVLIQPAKDYRHFNPVH